MAEYDNRGKVSVWARREDANERAPTLKGTVVAHRDIKEGEELELALWKHDKYEKNGRQPWAKGKISDKRGAPAAAESAPAPVPADTDPFHDDSIPF